MWKPTSADSIHEEIKLPLALISAQKLCGGSFMEWVSMAEYNAKHQME